MDVAIEGPLVYIVNSLLILLITWLVVVPLAYIAIYHQSLLTLHWALAAVALLVFTDLVDDHQDHLRTAPALLVVIAIEAVFCAATAKLWLVDTRSRWMPRL